MYHGNLKRAFIVFHLTLATVILVLSVATAVDIARREELLLSTRQASASTRHRTGIYSLWQLSRRSLPSSSSFH